MTEQPLFTDLTDATKKFKDLQRELDKSRKREREAVEKRMDLDELKESTQLTSRMLQVLLEDRDSDGADDKPVKDLVEAVKTVPARHGARKELSDIITESGLEWSDPQFEAARKLYSAGDLAGAIKAAREAGKAGGGSSESMEARVAAEVQRILKENKKVDTGDTAGAGGIPTDPKELNAKLKDPKWRKENRAKLIQMAREGLIKVA